MLNCFEAIKRSPALAVGLSVLTLGILPIGYLSYRIVQWISNTQLFEKVSDCFKKYCYCRSSQQEESYSSSIDEDSEDEDSDCHIEEIDSPLPDTYRLSPPNSPKHADTPIQQQQSTAIAPQEPSALDLQAYRFIDDDSLRNQIQFLRKNKYVFLYKDKEVQNRILIEILLGASRSNDKEFYEVLDEYLSHEILGDFRRRRFNAIFRLATSKDYSVDLIEKYFQEIHKIFEKGF